MLHAVLELAFAFFLAIAEPLSPETITRLGHIDFLRFDFHGHNF